MAPVVRFIGIPAGRLAAALEVIEVKHRNVLRDVTIHECFIDNGL